MLSFLEANEGLEPPGTLDRRAFTLVELLVVIAIIGILMAVITAGNSSSAVRLPAARSAKNNLEQLGFAAIAHFGTQKFFPTSGWGWSWVGDADRGYGINQPGGWAYNILPFIEESPCEFWERA